MSGAELEGQCATQSREKTPFHSQSHKILAGVLSIHAFGGGGGVLVQALLPHGSQSKAGFGPGSPTAAGPE